MESEAERREKFMRAALDEAQLAASLGEVPVGAVVVREGEIVARAHNEVEIRIDATAHAELIALQRASAALKTWRLESCELYVTLEPCPMCIGAILLSRVSRLYFGAYDEKLGAVGSNFNLAEAGLPRSVPVVSGVLADKCCSLLAQFFADMRGR